MKERTYICCDLKSFYASVECVERGLDPMTTNLVVADQRRTEKTICLAVSPSLKAYGIAGRARLFEVVERVKEVNAQRRRQRSRPASHRHLLARPGGAGKPIPGSGLSGGPAPDGSLYRLEHQDLQRLPEIHVPRRISTHTASTRYSWM